MAYLYEADREWENIFRHTLRSMFEGGVYDSVEGGFFRYSTTRDWNIPHFEKMLEDNAQLLHVLLTAYKLTADELFARASRDILRYLEANLYLPKQEGWAGSQDADENYYSLPMSERTKRAKPGIDRTIYVGWNALLIRSLFLAAVVLEEPKWFDRQCNVKNAAETLLFKRKRNGSLFGRRGHEGRALGLVEDQVAMGRALSTAYQHTGDLGWLELS